jgi:hypothetical protein
VQYCHECGYKLSLGTEKFCPKCGKYIIQRKKEEANGISISATKGDVIGTGVKGILHIFQSFSYDLF